MFRPIRASVGAKVVSSARKSRSVSSAGNVLAAGNDSNNRVAGVNSVRLCPIPRNPIIALFYRTWDIETPLFRVRKKNKTIYCYNEEEKQKAIKELGTNPEVTRFKGLGEISPDEFEQFISDEIRLEPLVLHQKTKIRNMLSYYMGKNTPERQKFIINNLRVEKDLIEQNGH